LQSQKDEGEQLLQRTTPTIQVCNKRAAECQRLAELAETTDKRNFYLRLATTWRTIAERREFPDRTQSFIGFMSGRGQLGSGKETGRPK
jgi:hypothetical protein